VVAELETYLDQLLSIRQDAEGLMSGLTDAQFNWRPAADQWSMCGCFQHLNASAAHLYKPAIEAALAAARRGNLRSQGPFVYPALERFFLRLTEPPPRLRTKAPRAFQPLEGRPLEEVRQEFMHWQDWLAERLREADGLDLRRARHRSPLGIGKWSLGTYFAVMLAHERRHLWQARQVRKQLPSSI